MATQRPPSLESAVRQDTPYPPQVQSLGEVPSVIPDVPVNVLFLVLFTIAYAGHAVTFRRNVAMGKKFLLSAMVFGFCLTRMIATLLRIAWACNPTNIHMAITATICVYAGIVLLFLANLLFAQRVVRAQHPRFGWSKLFSIPFPILIIITIVTILGLIAAVIVKFYTLKPASINAATGVQQYGAIWLAVVALLPVIIVGMSALARRHPYIRSTKTTDKFGEGSMRAKVAIVVASGIVLCLGASFRAGTTLMLPVPIMRPDNPTEPAPQPAYLSKACFYIFNFTLEVCVCFLWLAVRVDKRFYIPDGASGAFSYAGGFVFAGEIGNEKKRLSTVPGGQEAPAAIYRRDSRRGSRVSIVSERRRREKFEKMENRISWGDISAEVVQHIIAEDGKRAIPYPAVVERCIADEVAIDGIEKEMGWDSKSGKWAVRPIVSISKATSRPVSIASSSH